MIRHLFLLFLLSVVSFSGAGKTSASGPVHVSGYTKANGTYVAPYYRSAPGTAGSGGGSVSSPGPVGIISSETVPALTAPSGTYAGWSSVDPAWADVVLGAGFRNGADLTYGYSYHQTVPTVTAAISLLTRILKDEATADSSLLMRQEGAGLLFLVFRAEEPRALLVRVDAAGAGRMLQVLGFTYDSSALNVDGYAESSSSLLLAALGRSPSQASATPPMPVARPASTPLVGQGTNAPISTANGADAAPAGLVLDSNTMFLDPESGNVVVAATCAPFKVTFRPTEPFTRVELKVSSNTPVNYSLNVLAGDRLRYTQVDYTHAVSAPQDLLVGSQPAGTPVTLSFTNQYMTVDCQATLVLTLGAR